MAQFARLELHGWRQFGNVALDLAQQVTVLTGQNGCGKTTILSILGRHFGWNINFVSTPYLGKRRQERLWSDVRRTREADFDSTGGATAVGRIVYDDGSACELRANKVVEPQYQLKYSGQQPVVGLHIPSHRPVATYQRVQNVPTDPKTIEQHYQDFQQLLFQTYGSPNVRNPGIAQKQSLIALALFGYASGPAAPNLEYREMYESFQDILRRVLPEELGFQRLDIRMSEVVLVTSSGEFSLDAMSGGINALFGIAWQVHMYGAGKDHCTVLIDEPENHLHPSMQRSVLPSLAEAFPNYRFIVATHSPFVVSSFPEAGVYGLLFKGQDGVLSERLDVKELSGTPNRVLREILDVPSNLPLWVERRVRDVIRGAADQSPEVAAERLLQVLNELGISDALPDLNIAD